MTAQPDPLTESPKPAPRLKSRPERMNEPGKPSVDSREPSRPRQESSSSKRTSKDATAPSESVDAAHRQAAEPDALSEVLRAVRLRGAVFFVVDATAPWVAEAASGRELTPLIMPGVQHLFEYHIVTRGTCYGGLVDAPPIQLNAGDVILFPHGDAHVMSSAPKMRGVSAGGGMERLMGRPPYALKMSEAKPAERGDGPSAEVVCGFLGCDARPFNPLISTLPRVLHVRAQDEPPDGVLASLIALAVAESKAKRAGGDSMLSRLSELMFVEVLRRHLQSLPAEHAGWLTGLRDPIAGKALTLMHARPAKEWTLDDLARESHTSRSVLAERFKHFVGEPPMQYLARWRMQLAAGLLAEGNANVSAVAYEVGYGSEAAFSRAFKKMVGMSPAAWRANGKV
jgi:AraC-like DNA-binding protein